MRSSVDEINMLGNYGRPTREQHSGHLRATSIVVARRRRLADNAFSRKSLKSSVR